MFDTTQKQEPLSVGWPFGARLFQGLPTANRQGFFFFVRPNMANWIKVCKDTPQKREMALVQTITGLSQSEAFLEWFRLYSWADDQTIDGFIPHFTIDLLAHTAGVSVDVCRAFSSAEVNWIGEYQNGRGVPGIMFKNWERHNGECTKKRLLGAARAEKSRKRRSVTGS